MFLVIFGCSTLLNTIKTLDKQSMKIVIEFIKNLRPMIIDKNTIWVSGD